VKKEAVSTASEDHEDVAWDVAIKEKSDVQIKSISLSQWLNMWGRLCYGAAGLGDFPIWVQMLPKIFFEVIDTDSKQRIGRLFNGWTRKNEPLKKVFFYTLLSTKFVKDTLNYVNYYN